MTSGDTAATPNTREKPLGGSESHESEMNYAWSWFSLHSSQRMQLISYYLASMALLTSAWATLLAVHQWLTSVSLAVVAIVISVVFNLLDSRTRQLVQIGESALLILEQSFIGSQMNLVHRAESKQTPLHSYRILVKMLTVVFSLGYTVAILLTLIYVLG